MLGSEQPVTSTPSDSSAFNAAHCEALPEAVLVVREEVIFFANAAARTMLGEGIVGRPFDDVLAPSERHRLRLLEEQRLRGWELSATCRARFLRLDDKREKVTDLRFNRVDGDLVLSARDITDVTRAEELMGKLAQLSTRGSIFPDAEALLNEATPVFDALGWRVAFTELVPGGSITRRMIAPDGDPVGDYGRSLVDVFTPYDKTPILAEVVRTGQPLFLDNLPTLLPGPTQEATAFAKSMEQAHLIRSAWCPIVTNGANTHLLAVTGRDLTEYDFVAVQLFAAQIGAALHTQRLRLELVHHERLAAVGEMAAVMAHEVRNPIGVIFNALTNLRKQPSPPTTTSNELFDIIHEEAERLRRLVTDLLDFSRPAAIEVERVDVSELLRQAVNAAKLDPAVHGHTAPVEIVTEGESLTVETDPLLFRRALVNLIVNALQHVTVGGRVVIESRPLGCELHTRVENDGESVAPEIASRVFEPFFTTRASGTGLGLAVVRRIAEDLGGRVELDTSATAGRTSFVLVLPMKSPSTRDVAADSPRTRKAS